VASSLPSLEARFVSLSIEHAVLTRRIEDLEADGRDMEKRVRHLERYLYGVAGGVGLATVVLSVFGRRLFGG
jgi:hypothetical protein